MNKFKEGMAGPTTVLLAICLFFAVALVVVNGATKPIIVQGQIEAANKTRAEVFPGGGSFTEITDIALPDGVSEAYRADSGDGFVFTSAAKGFDGKVTFIIGIDKNGNITGIDMFDHSETQGLGSKIGKPDFLKNWFGSADPAKVDGITGATLTTNALRNALLQAKQAYELVKGAA